jgi:F-type H+-transporting ATPase subunit a
MIPTVGSLLTLAASDPVAHVVNHVAYKVGDWWVWSSNMGNLLLSALIMIFLGPWVARQIATGPESQGTGRYLPRSRFAHAIEVICIYLREEIVRPMLGSRTDRFMPFLWTLFFFILLNNLLGLVPLLDVHNLIALQVAPDLVAHHKAWIGGTLTQNIFVTGALATISFFVINIAGIRELGLWNYLKHLTAGAPAFVWPIIIPVEFIGTFVKPVALTIRLFANMTAGHILVATLLGFIGFAITEAQNIALGGTITLVSGLAAVAIYFLELFVAFLQAFVFMFLTAVFISQLAHHDEEHGHEETHPHAVPAH